MHLYKHPYPCAGSQCMYKIFPKGQHIIFVVAKLCSINPAYSGVALVGEDHIPSVLVC